MNALSKQIEAETKVMEAELEDRMEKGITDDKEAIAHYNKWMKMFKMDHLMLP